MVRHGLNMAGRLRWIAIGLASLLLLAYVGLNVWISYTPPIRVTGFSTLAVTAGEPVIVSVYLQGSAPVQPELTGVKVETPSFHLDRTCVIPPKIDQQFTAVAGTELPQPFNTLCTSTMPYTFPTRDFAVALFGEVKGEVPKRVDVAIEYRFLGMPHTARFALPLVEPR